MDENSKTKENFEIRSTHQQHSDDELENWTFVTSEESSQLVKNEGVELNHCDLSDVDGSDHGSDSGSSIVVIDSYPQHETNILKNSKVDTNSQSESSINPVPYKEESEVFSKEASPFLFVEDESACPASNEKECICQDITNKPDPAISEISLYNSGTVEENPSVRLDDVDEQNIFKISKDHNTYESAGIRPECEIPQSSLKESEHESDGIVSTNGTDGGTLVPDPLEKPEERCIDCSIEEIDLLSASVNSAEDLDEEAVHLEENEFSNHAEVEERSEEDNWELGLEALVNSPSLASSVSSLIDHTASPSPIVREEANGFNLVKPDLLEEANRIEELDQFDYSTVTNPDLPAELNVGTIMRERSYVHKPNQRLNVRLSYVVAFALAAVVGFALGNLVGLADNFPSRCATYTGKPNLDSADYSGLRAEIERLNAKNEELKLAANEAAEQLNAVNAQNFQLNELITENWDLKQSIGRIRYGKPARSIEDRHMINLLQTENQELRNAVGKLRYQCGQTLSVADQQALNKLDDSIFDIGSPTSSSGERILKLFGAMNLTIDWNTFIDGKDEDSAFSKLTNLKESATDLVELISFHREELANFTKENNLRSVEKMKASLHKYASKVISAIERVRNHQTSWELQIDEEQSRLEKLKIKMDNRWSSFVNPQTCQNEICPLDVRDDSFGGTWSDSAREGSQDFYRRTRKSDWSIDRKVNFVEDGFSKERETSLDSDWFLQAGRKREKIRHDEERSEWLFERAKNREQERRYRKGLNKQKKMKPSKEGNWKQFSS